MGFERFGDTELIYMDGTYVYAGYTSDVQPRFKLIPPHTLVHRSGAITHRSRRTQRSRCVPSEMEKQSITRGSRGSCSTDKAIPIPLILSRIC